MGIETIIKYQVNNQANYFPYLPTLIYEHMVQGPEYDTEHLN